MKNYFEEICLKLNSEIEIEHIDIVDNSYKHKKHKSGGSYAEARRRLAEEKVRFGSREPF